MIEIDPAGEREGEVKPVPKTSSKGEGEAPPPSIKTRYPSETVTPQSRERDIGHALRSVYQKTVDETVPPEFLDLLGKLG